MGRAPRRLITHPNVPEDILETAAFYEQQDASLAWEIFHLYDQRIKFIEQFPELSSYYFAEYRHIYLLPFSNFIVYRVKSDRIDVLALLDGRRDPRRNRELVTNRAVTVKP